MKSFKSHLLLVPFFHVEPFLHTGPRLDEGEPLSGIGWDRSEQRGCHGNSSDNEGLGNGCNQSIN